MSEEIKESDINKWVAERLIQDNPLLDGTVVYGTEVDSMTIEGAKNVAVSVAEAIAGGLNEMRGRLASDVGNMDLIYLINQADIFEIMKLTKLGHALLKKAGEL